MKNWELVNLNTIENELHCMVSATDLCTVKLHSLVLLISEITHKCLRLAR